LTEGSEWSAISNLDAFFTKVYVYYVEKGFWCMVATRITNIMSVTQAREESGIMLPVIAGAHTPACLLPLRVQHPRLHDLFLFFPSPVREMEFHVFLFEQRNLRGYFGLAFRCIFLPFDGRRGGIHLFCTVLPLLALALLLIRLYTQRCNGNESVL
jgi:hypothetical protein